MLEKVMVHSIHRSRSICHFHSMLFFIIRWLSSITTKKTSRQPSVSTSEKTRQKKTKIKTYEKHEQQKNITRKFNNSVTVFFPK